MAKERKRQRTKVFPIRLNAEEWAAVQQRADADRLSVAGVFRKAVFKLPRDKLPVQSRYPSPTPERAELARITAHLGKTGSNLNQLARIANLGGWPEHEDLAATCAEVRAACHALFVALGVDLPPKAGLAP